jgi:hypothetical protein
MEVPAGVYPGEGKVIVRLLKGLYGLKQSGRLWYYLLHKALLNLGFSRSDADNSIYSAVKNEEIIVIMVYVDDIIILCDHQATMDNTKSTLSKQFKMEDGAELSYILGIQITRDLKQRTMTMNQQALIERLVKTMNLEDAKVQDIPMHPSTAAALSAAESTMENGENVPYQSATGSINWIALSTRPDISYAVSILSSYNQKFGTQHWKAVKSVIRYLHSTSGHGLTIGGKEDLNSNKNDAVKIVGYSDASYGDDLRNRKSQGAYVFKIGIGAVTWQSKRQQTVALSTTEAEYMGMTQAAKEAAWLTKLFRSINVKLVTLWGEISGFP